MKNYQLYILTLLILGFTACSSTYKEIQNHPNQSSVDKKSKSNFKIGGQMSIFIDRSF